MNIFILDTDPIKCAAMHADQHVGKMLLEACQLLCSAHPIPTQQSRWLTVTAWHKAKPEERLRAGMLPYSRTEAQRNHPCAIWTRQQPGNFAGLISLAYALADEWEYRFSKSHASRAVIDWCAVPIHITFTEPTIARSPFTLAMPDQYRGPDPVLAYRRYYAAEKRVLRGQACAVDKAGAAYVV